MVFVPMKTALSEVETGGNIAFSNQSIANDVKQVAGKVKQLKAQWERDSEAGGGDPGTTKRMIREGFEQTIRCLEETVSYLNK